MCIHLTTHSAYSLQEGLALPVELAQAAQANGMPALGLTDHRLLSGSMEFVTVCKAAGVQPLLGLEIDLETAPLALLAMSMEGWSNLCRLSSSLALRNEPEAACPLEMLASYSRDLIAMPAQIPQVQENSEQGDALKERLGQLKEIFPNRLYITLQSPFSALQRSMLAHRLKLPTVVGKLACLGHFGPNAAVHPHGCGEIAGCLILVAHPGRFIPTGVGKLLRSRCSPASRRGSSPRVWGN